jgi:hypothetical protein
MKNPSDLCVLAGVFFVVGREKWLAVVISAMAP